MMQKQQSPAAPAVERPDHPELPIQPPLVFLGYLLSAVVLQWWVLALPFPGAVPLRILGGVLLITGLGLGFSAIAAMRKMHTTPDPHQPVTALVTTGPYSFTRNPIYLGFFLVYLGLTLLAGTLWGLLFSPFLIGTITRSIIHIEEAYLEKKFKWVYTQYRALVRRWI